MCGIGLQSTVTAGHNVGSKHQGLADFVTLSSCLLQLLWGRWKIPRIVGPAIMRCWVDWHDLHSFLVRLCHWTKSSNEEVIASEQRCQNVWRRSEGLCSGLQRRLFPHQVFLWDWKWKGIIQLTWIRWRVRFGQWAMSYYWHEKRLIQVHHFPVVPLFTGETECGRVNGICVQSRKILYLIALRSIFGVISTWVGRWWLWTRATPNRMMTGLDVPRCQSLRKDGYFAALCLVVFECNGMNGYNFLMEPRANSFCWCHIVCIRSRWYSLCPNPIDGLYWGRVHFVSRDVLACFEQ